MIVGDANMSEVATYLKVGTTAIVLAMIEDDALGDEWVLGNPVAAIRQVSHDPTLRQTIMLRDGSRATALEVQWGLFERAKKYEQSHGLACVGETVGIDVLDRWERVLAGLEADPSIGRQLGRLGGQATSRRRLRRAPRPEARARRSSRRSTCSTTTCVPTAASRSRAGLDTLVDPADAIAAMTEPPTTTRAYFRGRCLAKFPDDVVAANWDSLVFDVGRDPLRRVPMMEPLRGTAEHVATLIDTSNTARELLERLGQDA